MLLPLSASSKICTASNVSCLKIMPFLAIQMDHIVANHKIIYSCLSGFPPTTNPAHLYTAFHICPDLMQENMRWSIVSKSLLQTNASCLLNICYNFPFPEIMSRWSPVLHNLPSKGWNSLKELLEPKTYWRTHPQKVYLDELSGMRTW